MPTQQRRNRMALARGLMLRRPCPEACHPAGGRKTHHGAKPTSNTSKQYATEPPWFSIDPPKRPRFSLRKKSRRNTPRVSAATQPYQGTHTREKRQRPSSNRGRKRRPSSRLHNRKTRITAAGRTSATGPLASAPRPVGRPPRTSQAERPER